MLSLFKIQRKRIFWQFRYCITTIRFFVNRLFFRVSEQKRSIREHFSIAKELLMLVIKTIILSVVIVLLFKWLEYFLITYTGISNSHSLIALQEKVASNSSVAITLFSIIASVITLCPILISFHKINVCLLYQKIRTKLENPSFIIFIFNLSHLILTSSAISF